MEKSISQATTGELVSIIIPCYNQAQYLEEAVQSALQQTYQNIEIIIVNDGSSDESEEISIALENNYPQKIHLISQLNSGVSKARNNAIKYSKGKYILPLDADDILNENMVSQCMKTMIKSEADIVYVGFQCFGDINRIYKKEPFADTTPLYVTPCSVTALFKKNVWETIGGYKENMFAGYEDWEFWINAYKNNFKFEHLPEILFSYRTKEESRNNTAMEKDAYVKAKIIINHPELYTQRQVQNAIVNIKKTESLPNLYFYFFQNTVENIQNIIISIQKYLDSNELQKAQMIITDMGKIILLSLDEIENENNMNDLRFQAANETIIFYAPLRYEVIDLVQSEVALFKEKGITPVYGTQFPFALKSKRESPESQLIAYQRLEHYFEKLQKNYNKVVENYKKYREDMTQKFSEVQDKYTILKSYILLKKQGIDLSPFYQDILQYQDNGGHNYIMIKGRLICSPSDVNNNSSLLEIIKKDHTKIPTGLRLSGNQRFIFSYLKINKITDEFSVRFGLEHMNDLVSMRIRPWNNPKEMFIENKIYIQICQKDNDTCVFEKSMKV